MKTLHRHSKVDDEKPFIILFFTPLHSTAKTNFSAFLSRFVLLAHVNAAHETTEIDFSSIPVESWWELSAGKVTKTNLVVIVQSTSISWKRALADNCWIIYSDWQSFKAYFYLFANFFPVNLLCGGFKIAFSALFLGGKYTIKLNKILMGKFSGYDELELSPIRMPISFRFNKTHSSISLFNVFSATVNILIRFKRIITLQTFSHELLILSSVSFLCCLIFASIFLFISAKKFTKLLFYCFLSNWIFSPFISVGEKRKKFVSETTIKVTHQKTFFFSSANTVNLTMRELLFTKLLLSLSFLLNACKKCWKWRQRNILAL